MYKQYYKEFINQFHYLSDRHGRYNVFFDFLKLSSFSMYNSFAKEEKVEKEYLKIISKYKKEEIDVFCKMFSKLVLMYETKGEITDILGQVYMNENIGNKGLGQFFTPFHISDFMAKITSGTKESMQTIIDKNGFLTLNEPCSGAGTMILAFAKTMQDYGINFQQNLLAYAVDIDEMCTYMTYIQLSLYGIPAIVYNGDTLSQEMYFKLETPLYFLNYWKFRRKDNNEIYEENKEENIIKFNEVTKNGICQMSFF